MDNQMSEIREFFKRYNTNPYDVLGVEKYIELPELKKIYKRKARSLHPDKNKSKDATLQFQVLSLAYAYIKDRIKRKQKDFVELKESFKENKEEVVCDEEIVRYSAPVGGYFVQRGTETDYTKVMIDTPEQLMKKFNNDKFNSIFEYLKKNEEPQSAIELSGFSTDLSLSKVVTDGNIMFVGEESELDDYTNGKGMDYKKGFSEIKHPKKIPRGLDYSRKEIKEGTRKLKAAEIKSEINEKFKNIDVKYTKKFSEAQVDFVNNQIQSMRLEREQNENYIKKNSHLFPKGYLNE
jgi:curved DNA-binding protein CbpA